MTGWGQDGPLASTAGHDITYIATTGALHAIGRAGGSPQIPLNLWGDFAGGSMYLLVGLLAALDEARRSGRGQVVDTAIVDGTAHLMTMIYNVYAAGIWSDERGTNLGDAGTPYYGVYATLDEKHMAVGALEPKFCAEFMRLLGLPPDPAAQSDPAAWPHLKTHISDACVAPVLGLADAPEHPHLAARGTFFASDGVTQPAPAPRFSRNGGRPVMRTRRTHRGKIGWLAELRFLRLALGTEPPNQS